MPKKITILIKDKPKKDGLGVLVTAKMEELANTSVSESQATQVIFNGLNAVLKELENIK